MGLVILMIAMKILDANGIDIPPACWWVTAGLLVLSLAIGFFNNLIARQDEEDE